MRLRQALPPLLLGFVALSAYGCDDFRPKHDAAATAAPPAMLAATPPAAAATAPSDTNAAADPAAAAAPAAPAMADTPPAAASPMAQSIESAQPGSSKTTADAPSPLLIKTEVLLDRAHFSPGVIDGRSGENLTNALATYRKTHGLAARQGIDSATLSALSAGDKGPVTQAYIITADDESGPFIGKVPTGFEAQSKLDRLNYTSPVEELAAKFHMSQALLRTLNPGADFAKVGTSLVVVRPGAPSLQKVARVEVDKAANQVRALDGSGTILAAFPATVGSTERPAPTGELAVKSTTSDPDYTYDPTKLTFGPKSKGKITIKPGPNNPVGTTWIALSKDTYGIHGSPDPTLIGKTASHGCVRLTNWDAAALGKAVSKGTPVVFVGTTTKS
jgi:lipoprotein-anchoring transpeptidase ErfK/SrfK